MTELLYCNATCDVAKLNLSCRYSNVYVLDLLGVRFCSNGYLLNSLPESFSRTFSKLTTKDPNLNVKSIARFVKQQADLNIMVSFIVQDSVAFVTGTNKENGIGHAIVDALVAHGAAKVYATARHASELSKLVEQHNGKVIPVELDVTDLEAIEKLAELYPDVTLVVNNAGFFGGSSSLGDIDKIKSEIAVNYFAPLAIAKSFSSVFDKASSSDPDVKPTALVNINSIVSFINYPVGATYSASKAASHSLTQAQRRDLKNTLVIGVYPGPIDTAMADGMDSEKTPPSAVALAIIDALSKGTEDVFPDPISVYLHEGWKQDAKAMERQMAA